MLPCVNSWLAGKWGHMGVSFLLLTVSRHHGDAGRHGTHESGCNLPQIQTRSPFQRPCQRMVRVDVWLYVQWCPVCLWFLCCPLGGTLPTMPSWRRPFEGDAACGLGITSKSTETLAVSTRKPTRRSCRPRRSPKTCKIPWMWETNEFTWRSLLPLHVVICICNARVFAY